MWRQRAEAIYSLIGAAKLNGIDPEAYLRLVLENIADYRISHITDPFPLEPGRQTRTHRYMPSVSLLFVTLQEQDGLQAQN